MDGLRPRLRRWRWRRRGAWMWPSFIVLTVADTVIGHALPASSDASPAGDALLRALLFNLITVALVSRLAGSALRLVRKDLPVIVARDQGGTALLAALAGLLLVLGILHAPAITHHRAQLRDAIVRGQAWIGTRAPAEFRRNLDAASTVKVDDGIYRICVPGRLTARTYCVVVDTSRPLASSVTFDGFTSNTTFMAGSN